MTFNTFNEGKNIIVDATRKEEQASDGELVIAMNDGGVICFMAKNSGDPLSPLEVVDKTKVALDKIKDLNAKVDKVLKADLAKRAKEGMAEEARAENDR